MAGLEGRHVTLENNLGKLRQYISGLDKDNSLGLAINNIEKTIPGFNEQAFFNFNATLGEDTAPFIGTEISIFKEKDGPVFQQSLRTEPGYAGNYFLVTYKPSKDRSHLFLQEIFIKDDQGGRLILRLSESEIPLEQENYSLTNVSVGFKETEKNFELSLKGFGEMKDSLNLIFPNQLTLNIPVDK